MRTLEGQFSHLLEPSALIQGWHFRYAHEIAPAAELTTDGKTFRMAYSETWDVQSLRNSFVIEVKRLNPNCEITWIPSEDYRNSGTEKL